MFVTVFLGLLDTRTGVLTYTNAGHPAPLILRASGEITEIEGRPEVPLGVQGGATFQSRAVSLQRSDAVFVFSDGIIEATNEAGVLYGLERLTAQLRIAANAVPTELVRIVADSIGAFTGGAPKADDVTALALRWSPA
jgi:sigma-B regulation protein RsbU (phosphoserine phosphatase)